MLKEDLISGFIIDEYLKSLKNSLNIDIVVVGSGPSGLVASYYLAKRGYSVSIFEKRLSVGGGIWGGGMMFNKIIVQDDALEILNEFYITYKKIDINYNVCYSIEFVSGLIYKAKKAGVKIFNLISVEDLVFRENTVSGVVINWSPVIEMGLHVDPISIISKVVIDATGHPAEIVKILEKKNDVKLNTPTGHSIGERSMWADFAEKNIVNYVKEIYPGLFVTGMAAVSVFGAPRMGPIFGGMLISGRDVAVKVDKKLGGVP